VVTHARVSEIDLVLYLMGQEPASVNTYGLTAISGAGDHIVAYLGFGTNPLVTATASR
jgi:predicted dehydrogenase